MVVVGVAAALSAVQLPSAVAAGSRGQDATLTAAAVQSVSPSLVQVIQTSQWSPASPDPSGVVYLSDRQRLEVCDSEVDERTGAGYHGVNLWQTRSSGTVTDTGTTLPYSNEPTGLGYDASSRTLFVSDDVDRKIWMIRPGSDGRYGTSDDNVGSINVGQYGSTDTEDPEFDPATGHLFFLDGIGTEVYEIDPVDGTFGNANDVVTHFDISGLGPRDFEGLGSDQANGTLLVGARKALKIFEITKTGSLVRIINATNIAGLTHISGLKMAPASDGSGRMDYWIVDRGVDNGKLASENDGQLFELSLGATTTNRPPVLTNPGPQSNQIGDTVSFQIQASDPDAGDTIASYGASGLPTGLSVNTSTGLISGTTTEAGPFETTISATDNDGATGSVSFTWTVTAGSGSTITIGPEADTWIASDTPDANFGGRVLVKVNGSPDKDTLIRFRVSGVGSGTVAGATLRLFVEDASTDGGTVYAVSNNSWGEKTVTWNTAPAAGSSLGSFGAVATGTWAEVDLGTFVTGDGTYSFRISNAVANVASYTSREGTAGFGPQLVLQLA